MTTCRREPTAELDVTSGAPRRLLAEAFPILKSVQTDYRDAVGPIRVPAGPANPGTIGTAFDVWVQLQATARPHLEIATAGAALVGVGGRGGLLAAPGPPRPA